MPTSVHQVLHEKMRALDMGRHPLQRLCREECVKMAAAALFPDGLGDELSTSRSSRGLIGRTALAALAHLDCEHGVPKLLWNMIVNCARCGRENRVPARHLSHRGRCGACKATLGPVAAPLDVDPATFDDIVANAPVPVLVDFWASWCGPCRMVAPEVKKVAERLAGKAVVLKVDTDQHPELGARFGVRSIPNFVVFQGGKQVSQQAGALSQERLVSMLASASSGQATRAS
jgi:thioredoxin 2